MIIHSSQAHRNVCLIVILAIFSGCQTAPLRVMQPTIRLSHHGWVALPAQVTENYSTSQLQLSNFQIGSLDFNVSGFKPDLNEIETWVAGPVTLFTFAAIDLPHTYLYVVVENDDVYLALVVEDNFDFPPALPHLEQILYGRDTHIRLSAFVHAKSGCTFVSPGLYSDMLKSGSNPQLLVALPELFYFKSRME